FGERRLAALVLVPSSEPHVSVAGIVGGEIGGVGDGGSELVRCALPRVVHGGESLDLPEDIGFGGVVTEGVLENGLGALHVAGAVFQELGQIEADAGALPRRACI